jgi:TPR repeat protein
MKHLAIALSLLLLAGCDQMIQDDSDFPPDAPETPAQAYATTEEEVQALLKQKYIDPITAYIRKHDKDPAQAKQIARLSKEREKRCAQATKRIENRPKDRATLKKVEAGYKNSCPQIVEDFAAAVERTESASAPPEKPAEKPAEKPEPAEAATAPEAAEAEAETPPSTPAKEPTKPALDRAAINNCQVLYAIKNYNEAISACVPLARQGSAEAQYRLGLIYRLLSDYPQAAEWTQKAVDQGMAEAYVLLSELYIAGYGVRQDYAEAAKWQRKAAEAGLVKAQISLAKLYQEGKGVKANPAEAARWLRQAAQTGDAEAQLALGLAYLNGVGVARDANAARGWLLKAAEQGETEAQFNLGKWHADNNDPVEAYAWLNLAWKGGNQRSLQWRDRLQLSSSQIPAAQQRAKELLDKYQKR